MIKALGVSVIALSASSAMAQFVGPTPYLSAADSPFTGSFQYSYLENFEDGVPNTPGATASPGWITIGPGPAVDSVDADDGAIDGSGTVGRSFFSNQDSSSLTITFDGLALGGLPTHAGIVWTDVGQVTSGSFATGPVTFAATGPGGVSLGSTGPFVLGDGAFTGQTAEDRFFGIVDLGGISSITISMGNSVDWEVDHLQYARVPEPTAAAIGLLGAAFLARRRR